MKLASELSTDSITALRLRLGSRGISENTLRGYCSDLRLFLEATGSETVEIGEYEELAMMWLQMNRKKVAPKTSARRLTSIKAFAKLMFGLEVLTEYQGPETAPGAPHPIPEGMAGVNAMMDCAANAQHKALIALCGKMGCRIQEALDLTYENFDWNGMTLRIRGKGDKTRFVPIPDDGWDYLADVVAASMIRSMPLINMHERYARKVITQLGERANLSRKISSHDLRATFATAIYDLTRNIRLVQWLLGHVNVTTTQIYVGVEMEALRSAVNSI